ncbi:MAG: hypothetical protein NT062_18980 [Proteobacteria bacterium]|nr:hypothetical protein [Pseudomonadota bacterium]
MVLTVAGLAVLGLGVYLFVEIRAGAVEVKTVERVETVEAGEGRAARVADVSQRPSRPDVKPLPKPVVRDSNPAPFRPNNMGSTSTSGSVVPVDAGLPADLANMTNDQLMPEANKALDRRELDAAVEIAGKVLKDDPNNVWMLRVMVSAACLQGDAAVAQKHYLLLAGTDREEMATRCSRYGMTLDAAAEGSDH